VRTDLNLGIHRLEDPVRAFLDIVQRIYLGHHNDKLVAADADDRVGAADSIFKPSGGDYEQLVTDIVSEPVIDLFKVIQIDQEHCHFALGALCPFDRLIDPVV
jgi:hypothetical protein